MLLLIILLSFVELRLQPLDGVGSFKIGSVYLFNLRLSPPDNTVGLGGRIRRLLNLGELCRSLQFLLFDKASSQGVEEVLRLLIIHYVLLVRIRACAYHDFFIRKGC